ncbi:hypothetical protein SC206_19755 [Rouxiella sp. T17]|uniref:hypothetical protein n=1 Tax=Rouxiella sp. T17 TaxID=3085684 RepID=UPI002FC947D9
MTETVTLTIKIPADLKEQIREAALHSELSLSAEVCSRLENSFTDKEEKDGKPEALEIDNQHLGEQAEPALTQKELKKLRLLIAKPAGKSTAKTSSKSTSKKK